jgi:hypothetical protein
MSPHRLQQPPERVGLALLVQQDGPRAEAEGRVGTGRSVVRTHVGRCQSGWGHSSFTLTLDTYGDWIPEADGGVADTLLEPTAPAKPAEVGQDEDDPQFEILSGNDVLGGTRWHETRMYEPRSAIATFWQLVHGSR